MKVGLYFGSFNPLHLGHKIIASYIAEFTDLDRVTFVVSPQNPLKEKKDLLDQSTRLQIIKSEIKGVKNLEVTDIEFNMPNPSYTIDTLQSLKEKTPKHEFCLIMGADNFENIHMWKNFKQILENYTIYVYPRNGIIVKRNQKNIMVLHDMPQIDISASFIRKKIYEGKDVSYLMPEKAWEYIDKMKLYKK